MSTTDTAARTISVTAEEEAAILIGPYWGAMRRLYYALDVEYFDPGLSQPETEIVRSAGEHVEWLEAWKQQPDLERWIAVLRQLENGRLVAEPWLLERIRETASEIELADPQRPDTDPSTREVHRCNARRFAALNGVVERLEAASRPVVSVTPEEVETLLGNVITLQLGDELTTEITDPAAFETLRAAMNLWAPVYAALDDGVLPALPFVVEAVRREYATWSLCEGHEEIAARIGSVLERLELAAGPVEVTA